MFSIFFKDSSNSSGMPAGSKFTTRQLDAAIGYMSDKMQLNTLYEKDMRTYIALASVPGQEITEGPPDMYGMNGSVTPEKAWIRIYNQYNQITLTDTGHVISSTVNMIEPNRFHLYDHKLVYEPDNTHWKFAAKLSASVMLFMQKE